MTLITGAGTVILGLSWLIGGALQEVLTSIIFLFIKHPFDVGDRVTVDQVGYTVKEIQLLSTIFLDGNNCMVQAPNAVLSTKVGLLSLFAGYPALFADLNHADFSIFSIFDGVHLCVLE